MHMTIVEYRSLPKELSINVTLVVFGVGRKGKEMCDKCHYIHFTVNGICVKN